MTGKNPLNNRNIRSTVQRPGSFQDHQPPSGKHAGGKADIPWRGSRRIVDRPARDRWNKRTWDRLRRTTVMKEEPDEI